MDVGLGVDLSEQLCGVVGLGVRPTTIEGRGCSQVGRDLGRWTRVWASGHGEQVDIGLNEQLSIDVSWRMCMAAGLGVRPLTTEGHGCSRHG